MGDGYSEFEVCESMCAIDYLQYCSECDCSPNYTYGYEDLGCQGCCWNDSSPYPDKHCNKSQEFCEDPTCFILGVPGKWNRVTRHAE